MFKTTQVFELNNAGNTKLKMKSILENIKNYWSGPQANTEVKDTTSDVEDLNYITFLIDEESGEPYIKMSLKDLSDTAAKNYGEMLYDINAGLYNESILKILVDFSKEDEKINKFVKDVIMYWYSSLTLKGSYIDDKNTEKPWLKRPQISPIDFNKNAK